MFGFDLDGKLGNFIRIMGMTCSYQESINHTKPSDLQKAKSECSSRENCTGVRTNECYYFVTDRQISYDFCNDDPIPSQQPGTISSFEVYVPGLCVYKKPDGEFGFVIEHVPAVISFIIWCIQRKKTFHHLIFSACS